MFYDLYTFKVPWKRLNTESDTKNGNLTKKYFFFEAFPVFFKNFRKFLKSNFSFKLLLNKITVKFYICMIKCKQPKMLLALYSPFHVKFRF